MKPDTITIILGRKGSKGVIDKNTMDILGRPSYSYSFDAAKKSKYIDNREALTETIKLQGYDIPSFLSNQVGSINCNSWEDAAPLLNNNFPILIFSHGHGGLRTQNTNQVEELVSHGYIVIAMDHTYDAGFVEFFDGKIAYSLTARPDDNTIIVTPEEFYTRFSVKGSFVIKLFKDRKIIKIFVAKFSSKYEFL